MNHKTLPVLMTASVCTRGMKGACFSDEERERMYASALCFYIRKLTYNPDQRIIFAENSGWDLNHLKELLPPFNDSQIEFLSAPIEMFDISKGKGYNELLLINYAISNSLSMTKMGGVAGFSKLLDVTLFLTYHICWKKLLPQFTEKALIYMQMLKITNFTTC